MAEYITKDVAKAIVTKAATKHDTLMMIEALPTVDAVTVKHGRWIPCHPLGDDAPEGYMCSVCHVGGWEKTNFCPNCGAKDGEWNDNEAD